MNALKRERELNADLLFACRVARELCITVLGEVDADNIRDWATATLETLERVIDKVEP